MIFIIFLQGPAGPKGDTGEPGLPGFAVKVKLNVQQLKKNRPCPLLRLCCNRVVCA